MVTAQILEAARAAYGEHLKRAAALSTSNGHVYRDWAICQMVGDVFEFDDLQGLARAFAQGGKLQRAQLSADGLALEYYAEHCGGPAFDEKAFRELPPHHWFIVEDQSRLFRVPKKLPADPEYWAGHARRWRDSHRNLRGREVIVCMQPGRRVHFILWHPTPVYESDATSIVWEMSGDASEPRFVQAANPFELPADIELPNGEWRAPMVYLPAETNTKTLRERRSSHARITGRPTGIKALDGILSGGYLPSNAVVAVGGDYGQGKTTCALEALENLATEPESFNVYLVIDEPEAPIRARRLQRRGYSREAARAALGSPAEDALERESALLVVPVAQDELFEDVLEQVKREAGSRQINVVVDSVQKLKTREGTGRGTLQRVTAASQAIRSAVNDGNGRLRIVFISEVTRGTGELKDAAALDFDADLTLIVSMNAAEDELAFQVRKNRFGPKTPFRVPLDREGQRLDPTPHTELWHRARAFLAERPGDGCAAQTEIENALGGKRERVRQMLRVWVERKLLEKGKLGYRLPRPA